MSKKTTLAALEKARKALQMVQWCIEEDFDTSIVLDKKTPEIAVFGPDCSIWFRAPLKEQIMDAVQDACFDCNPKKIKRMLACLKEMHFEATEMLHDLEEDMDAAEASNEVAAEQQK